jgi:hypothetical protein
MWIPREDARKCESAKVRECGSAGVREWRCGGAEVRRCGGGTAVGGRWAVSHASTGPLSPALSPKKPWGRGRTATATEDSGGSTGCVQCLGGPPPPPLRGPSRERGELHEVRRAVLHAAAAPLPSPPPQAGRLWGREPFLPRRDLGRARETSPHHLPPERGRTDRPQRSGGGRRRRGHALPSVARSALPPHLPAKRRRGELHGTLHEASPLDLRPRGDLWRGFPLF